ncbi:MAG: polysaccharide deacetylase family protein [Pseudomonadota bacterium]
MDSKKWQPSSFIKASAAIHVGSAAALIWPAAMELALACLAANHAALTAAGLTPKSCLLGSNIRRMNTGRPEIALTLDDGPDPIVTPLVLDILARHDIKATFFCIAENVRKHPELARKIVAAGHDIENHSMLHRHHFSLLGKGGLKKELMAAQQTIEDIGGRKPRFFRAPAGLRNFFLDPVLHQLDLQLVSWTRRGFDTRETDPKRIAERLLSGARAGDILLLHDGNAARDDYGHPVVLQVLPQLIDDLTRRGLRFVTLEQGMRVIAP